MNPALPTASPTDTGQTRKNPTLPTVPHKAFLEAIISDTNFFDHQHNNGNANIPTGNFISDINFLDHQHSNNNPTGTSLTQPSTKIID